MDKPQIIQPGMSSDSEFCNRSEAFEAADDAVLSPDAHDTIGDIIQSRFSRRQAIFGLLGVAAATSLFGTSALVAANKNTDSAFAFPEVASGIDETHHLADGYTSQILLRWGDPLFENSPRFDPRNQSAAAQLRQFGYNNDYVGFIPLGGDETRGLLCVNHEYTNEEVMFPVIGRQDRSGFREMTRELVDIEMAAHGGTVVEISQDTETRRWSVVQDSAYNRRISPLHTTMVIDGPAAGHERLMTSVDPSGMQVIGTLNNCAGGITPWGTYLMAEENFHGYFWTDDVGENGRPLQGLGGVQSESYARYGVPGNWYSWGKFHDRFNIAKEPNEPNRFGWVVEVDPLDPTSPPVKHTALGRFRHEGAEPILSRDGRVVVYSGDDARFDYVYKFVSRGKFEFGSSADVRTRNKRLLSDGTLYVAKFSSDGHMDWLPLVHGQGPLTAKYGFASQADVLIDTRLAADALGATPMDRPEDVEPAPRNGRVYVMLTNNHKRQFEQEDDANPRANNAFGHVIELRAPNGDHTALRFEWDILLKCGDPSIAEVGASWNPATSEHGWFGSPDNCAFDARGRLWISTDQGKRWPATGKADGLYAIDTDGKARGRSQLFFRCPIGAELCGPTFTPDDRTLFLAVQHPGTDGTKAYKPFGRASTFEDPATRWPDFQPDMPPRPSIVVVQKTDGGPIG